jgi:DNA helicase-2/ATP-dependent DNA helicase PcrA
VPWNTDLEGVHLEIAAETATPMHVLAGPGTGKTFAMMRRIARLLEAGATPEAVLAVSFTRTAAKDLREQLQRLGTPSAESVVASTLHSLCFRLLNRADVFEQTRRIPRPLLSFEVHYMELDLKDQFGGLREVRRLLAAYEAAWARLQTESPGGPADDLDAAFHAAITDWLRYHQAMLVGELIPLTLRFIQQNPASEAIPPFEHVLVDEYQDLNRAEQELIDYLAREGSLTVIGDDCQSIYSFRHANPEGIREFAAARPGTVSLSIETCRRCPPNIVRMSNALIAFEPRRTRPIPLAPDNTRPDAGVTVVQHRTLEEEVETIADYVAHYLRQNPELAPGQVLVLTPRRFIGNQIKDRLIRRGLNALSYFAEDPVQEAPAAEGFALLTLLVNPRDRPALRAWLGMGSTGGLAGGYRRLREASEPRGAAPDELLRGLADGSVTIPHTKPLVARWNLLQVQLETLRELRGLDLIRRLWPVGEEKCDEVRLIAEAIALGIEDPEGILDSLRQEITQPYLPDSTSDIVRVMSLHKSKGLTASLVVIAGCMSGALPRVDSDATVEEQERQIQEQRRLFYVAITRATDTLVISSSTLLPFADAMRAQVQIHRQRFVAGVQMAETVMSPFVGELGASCPRAVLASEWRRIEGF